MLDIEDLQVMVTGLDGGTMLEISNLKPSIVLSAMVAGLLKSKDDPLFKINMGTFGEVKNDLCYGCCATVALTEIFGKGRSISEVMLVHAKAHAYWPGCSYTPLSEILPLEPSNVQSSLSIDKLRNLEVAVDNARKGLVSLLIHFLTGDLETSFDRRWHLDDEDWEGQLPEVERTIAEMIVAGY